MILDFSIWLDGIDGWWYFCIILYRYMNVICIQMYHEVIFSNFPLRTKTLHQFIQYIEYCLQIWSEHDSRWTCLFRGCHPFFFPNVVHTCLQHSLSIFSTLAMLGCSVNQWIMDSWTFVCEVPQLLELLWPLLAFSMKLAMSWKLVTKLGTWV